MERLYLDTSVFGGYFEPEFELWSKMLLDQIKEGKYLLLYSQLTDNELNAAPQKIKDLVFTLQNACFETVEFSKETDELAEAYIQEKVVGQSSIADCLHIALATLNNADVLVSWNFKHIVNLKRIRGYNAVNYKFGHQLLEIRTPREILEYEN